ncbi:conserved hypothetical protein [uncultured Sporomusa sp.]|uniref:phosphoribosylglycinamide formyltransferase 1 n=1 Tax=uncultured Sporomusa sp. TaxID=307249 RepID=A0A212M1U0_9FIRM|nr:dTDP-4-amino-4,6-dideoxyglucose formyltransferase [uncultured Sporomusa sp.]SCM83629.1 conserved hypothetical protein [uncultured Sporomusa sp.]
MIYNKVLIFSDNPFLLEKLLEIIKEKKIDKLINFKIASSPFSNIMLGSLKVEKINIIDNLDYLINNFNLIISAHCKQIFPSELIEKVKCINIHPGLNPFNRGWYPQVFSIINKLPVGATIHEMDDEIDHGHIIIQKEVQCHSYDTSETVYNRVLEMELILFEQVIEKILNNKYDITTPVSDGNINLKSDFNEICNIDLKKDYTGQEFIDLLRALTHGNYNNAYFYDEDGNKIFVKISLQKENYENKF